MDRFHIKQKETKVYPHFDRRSEVEVYNFASSSEDQHLPCEKRLIEILH